MKKTIAIILIALSFGACTENQRARNFGGTEKITLPKGERLVIAAWKQDNLWYLTEQMPEGYTPQTRTFKEKSSFGAMEGTVIFYETK
ncbi:MAG: hypothetical protein ACK53H_09025 [Betaproteobacteria bacterium]|jgi:hypothetical protein